MTTRNVNKQASALAKARERRRELDKARDEQDRRVELATATALVAAESSLRESTEGLADALRRLVDQDVSIERAAALLELDATEVRRLTKTRGREAKPTLNQSRA